MNQKIYDSLVMKLFLLIKALHTLYIYWCQYIILKDELRGSKEWFCYSGLIGTSVNLYYLISPQWVVPPLNERSQIWVFIIKIWKKYSHPD